MAPGSMMLDSHLFGSHLGMGPEKETLFGSCKAQADLVFRNSSGVQSTRLMSDHCRSLESGDRFKTSKDVSDNDTNSK